MGLPFQSRAAGASSRDSFEMYAATFCIFSPCGLLISMIQTSAWPWAFVAAITLFSGFMAVGTAFSFSSFRRRWWVLVPVQAAPFVVPHQMYGWLRALGLLDAQSDMPEFTRRLIMAIACLVLLSLGFTLLIRYLSRTSARAAELRTELDLASRIHKSLVPPIRHRGPIAEVVGGSEPSGEFGGDLVDMVERDGVLGLFLADVSGHGVRAGVLMAMVKSAIRSRVLEGGGRSPGEVAGELNRVLCEVSEPDMFATYTGMVLSPGGAVEYSLAGHLPLMLVRRDGTLEEFDNESMPLGVDPSEWFPSRTLRTRPGDTLVVFTDGLIEALSAEGEQFGMERFRRALAGASGMPLETLYRSLLEAVRAHGVQSDDQSLLLIRVQ